MKAAPFLIHVSQSGFGISLFTLKVDYDRSGDANRRIRTDNDTDQQGEGKSADHLSSEYEDGQQYEEDGQGRIDGTAQRGVQGVVDDLFLVGAVMVKPNELADTVKHHHGIGHGITHNRKNGSDEGLIDFQRERKDTIEDGEEGQYDDSVVKKSHNSSKSILPTLESNKDVNEHQSTRDEDGPYC